MWFVGVSRSQQKVADMKQVSSIMKESVWVEDKNITDCKGCKKPFSVSRRKVCGQWLGRDVTRPSQKARSNN